MWPWKLVCRFRVKLTLLNNESSMFCFLFLLLGINTKVLKHFFSSFVVVGVGPFFFKVMQGKYGLQAFVAGLTISFIAIIGGCGGFALGNGY